MSRAVHVEIHASDPEALSKFHADMFGWRITHMPQLAYWLMDTGDSGPGINGGMMKRMGPKPPGDGPVNGFVISLGIASVDATLAKARAAGAAVGLPKMAIPGIGWPAYIKDPDNNLVGLHQPDNSAK